MIKGWVCLHQESWLSRSSKLFPSPLLCHGNHLTQFHFLEPGRLTAFQGDECQSLAPHIPVFQHGFFTLDGEGNYLKILMAHLVLAIMI